TLPDSSDLLFARICEIWRPDQLRRRRGRRLSSGGNNNWAYPQGREASRPSGAAGNENRAGDQPQDRESARPRRALVSPAARRAASATIPIVAIFPENPVKLGLVTSLARPDGNLTGINLLNAELVAKQLELLRELVPQTARIAVLVNPENPTTMETTLRDAERAALAMGVQIRVLRVSTSREIDMAFATFVHERPDALFVSQDPFLPSRRVQLVQLVAHHRIPTIYSGREYAEIGGLMSYAASIIEAFRQIGV